MKRRRMKSSRSPDIARPVSHVPILDAVRAAVPTLFDGFVLHAFTDETSPPSSHEELVIGGETGYFLEPRLRRDMVVQVIATLEPSGEPGAVQPKRVGLPRPGDNDAKGFTKPYPWPDRSPD